MNRHDPPAFQERCLCPVLSQVCCCDNESAVIVVLGVPLMRCTIPDLVMTLDSLAIRLARNDKRLKAIAKSRYICHGHMRLKFLQDQRMKPKAKGDSISLIDGVALGSVVTCLSLQSIGVPSANCNFLMIESVHVSL